MKIHIATAMVVAAAQALTATAYAHTLSASEATSFCLGPAFQSEGAKETCLQSVGVLNLRAYVVSVDVAGEHFTLNLKDGDPPSDIEWQGMAIRLMARPTTRPDLFIGALYVNDESAPEDKQFGSPATVILKPGQPIVVALPTGKTLTLNLTSIQSKKGANMGVVANITVTEFPKQGDLAGKRVLVCFHHDKSRVVEGVVLRDDVEAPYRRIIHLDDGRVVLDTECQFQPV